VRYYLTISMQDDKVTSVSKVTIPRELYIDIYGPTVGDKVHSFLTQNRSLYFVLKLFSGFHVVRSVKLI